MALPDDTYLTEAEYLALESPIRHEFVDGRALAMTGASERHIDITVSTSSLLYAALREMPCKLYQGDMRVKVASNYFYPDLTVVCGERDFSPETSAATLLNPTVIIEVLSPSTEAYDRGKKFHEYRKLPSLKDYLLISQDVPRVECFSRQARDTWMLVAAEGQGASIAIPALGVDLALATIYEQVTFA